MFILAELRNLIKLHPRGFDKSLEQQIQVIVLQNNLEIVVDIRKKIIRCFIKQYNFEWR